MRTLKGTVINSAWMFVVYHGQFNGNQSCQNVTKFLLWFMLFSFAAAAFLPNEKRRSIAGNRNGFAMVFSAITDIAVTLMLAINGWFGYATISVIQGLLCHGLLEEGNREASK